MQSGFEWRISSLWVKSNVGNQLFGLDVIQQRLAIRQVMGNTAILIDGCELTTGQTNGAGRILGISKRI